ncbi:LamG domain-containing protein, partial [Mariniblastus sp.]|nr:LamG domain-containing protein [Mariniblastus sp.]
TGLISQNKLVSALGINKHSNITLRNLGKLQVIDLKKNEMIAEGNLIGQVLSFDPSQNRVTSIHRGKGETRLRVYNIGKKEAPVEYIFDEWTTSAWEADVKEQNRHISASAVGDLTGVIYSSCKLKPKATTMECNYKITIYNTPAMPSFSPDGEQIRIVRRPLQADVSKMNGLEIGKIKPSNAVACWKLDRRTGAVIDTYGVNNGVNHNSKRGQKGRINNAFCFDGEGDYVLIPDSDSLDLSNSLTISMWVNPNRHRNWQGLIGKWQTGQQSFAITPSSSGHIRWISSVSGRGVSNEILGKTPIPLKTWSHIAVTKDGSSLKFYLNGRLDKDASIAAQLYVGKSSLFIGSESTFWAFDGSIDEVIILNTALNATELAEIYKSGVAGKSSDKFRTN